MYDLQKGLKVILIAQLLLLLIYSTSYAVQATGVGLDREQALKSAFQSAIEAELGVAVESTAVSQNFMLIKSEIITHSKGYVTSYQVVNETTASDGSITIVIEAQVNRKLLTDHTQTLEILMKMAGHPKVLIFGIDEDFNAVPSGTEIFDQLINVVSKVFKEKFKFDVLDWQALRAKHPHIEGGLNRDLVLHNNNLFQADLMILVGLNLQNSRQSGNARLMLKGVRISDNQLIGEAYRKLGPFKTKGLSEQKVYQAAVTAAEKDDIFIGAVDLARKIIDSMQSELDRGHGIQYTLTFYKFPDSDKLKDSLTQLEGYVRHNMDLKQDNEMTVTYWSNLKSDALLQQIQKLLETENVKYKSKVEGRVLKFKWVHPEGF